jgi:drug/metabolite transporter (DMT)-like permease
MTLVAFFGIFLVLAPGELRIAWGSLWGLASGITAAFAIIFLNLARQHNDTDTVLFIVFGIGTALLSLFFWKDIHVPNRLQLFYLVLCASMAVIGQYLLTMGFRYVSPVKGGIISLFRLLFAVFLGPYITSDPALKMSGWIGALLILGTNIYFIVRKSKV